MARKNIKEKAQKLVLYYSLVCGIAFVDHLFKLYAEKNPGAFKEVVKNKGFTGEKMSDRPDLVRNTSLIITGLNLAALPFFPERTPEEKLRKAGWILMSGGGLSNTADRIIRREVIDYIRKGKYVYNLGDFAIAGGCAAYLSGVLLEALRNPPDPVSTR